MRLPPFDQQAVAAGGAAAVQRIEVEPGAMQVDQRLGHRQTLRGRIGEAALQQRGQVRARPVLAVAVGAGAEDVVGIEHAATAVGAAQFQPQALAGRLQRAEAAAAGGVGGGQGAHGLRAACA